MTSEASSAVGLNLWVEQFPRHGLGVLLGRRGIDSRPLKESGRLKNILGYRHSRLDKKFLSRRFVPGWYVLAGFFDDLIFRTIDFFIQGCSLRNFGFSLGFAAGMSQKFSHAGS